MATARDEILQACSELKRRLAREVFSVREILDALQAKGTDFSESTLRTHITSRMCGEAPKNHGTVYNDLQRASRGMYRLVDNDPKPQDS